MVVTSAERARDLRSPPVLIKGFGTFNNLRGWTADRNMIETAAKGSGQVAYRMAGLGPRDIDTAQIYDCFTGMVVAQLEDYGFCSKGEGGPFVASGALKLNGRLCRPIHRAANCPNRMSKACCKSSRACARSAIPIPERQVAGADIASFRPWRQSGLPFHLILGET